MRALCTKVLTRLTLRCLGQKELQSITDQKSLWLAIYTGEKSSNRLFKQNVEKRQGIILFLFKRKLEGCVKAIKAF